MMGDLNGTKIALGLALIALLAAPPVASAPAGAKAQAAKAGLVTVTQSMQRGRPCVVLKNGRVALCLDRQQFTLVDMVDAASGESFVAEPGSPLFRIAFGPDIIPPLTTPKPCAIDGSNARKRWFKVLNTGRAKTLELHFDDCRLTLDGNSANVTVTVTLGPDDTVFSWGLRTKTSAPLPLGDVCFPTLSGLGSRLSGSRDADYLVAPMGTGQRIEHPRTQGACGQGTTEYPSGGVSIQMLAYCDGLRRGSLCLAALDGHRYRKTFCSTPMLSRKSFGWYVLHYADPGVKANAWALPYKVACGPIAGDWYDAAKFYRRWALSGGGCVPLARRTDIPQWFRDLSVWFQGQDRNPHEERMAKHVERLLNIRQKLGEDYGFHWYLWQKDGTHDYRYPDYFPSQPGFKEAIATVQKAGVHVMPYFNVELFDTMTGMWTEEKADAWASRDSHGDLYRVVWDDGRKMVNMCPATRYWQDKMVACGVRLVREYGAGAVYLDELHVYPYLCYAGNHLHSTLGGTHFVDGYREIIRRIRAESGRKDLVVTGEACSDAYADLLSGQLIAHCDTAPDSIPMFQSAVNDCTIQLGLTMMRGEAQDLDCFVARTGFALVRGRQLGWIQFDQTDLLGPEYDRQMEFLRKAARCRRASRDLVMDGEFVRPPDLSGAPVHAVRWNQDKTPIRLSSVQGGAYRSRTGDLGLVLVNITGKPLSVRIPVNAKDWQVRPGRRYLSSEYRDGAWTAPVGITLGKSVDVEIPAYTPVTLRLRPEKKP